MSKNIAVFGIFFTRSSVEATIKNLKIAGFRGTDISALGWRSTIGALAFPGVGPFIAAGPIVAALASAGAAGALGGITGGLVGLGFPEYEARRYDGRIRKGGLLLSVHTDNSDWTRKAKEILQRTGAEDISTTGEAGSNYAKTNKPLPRIQTSGEGIGA